MSKLKLNLQDLNGTKLDASIFSASEEVQGTQVALTKSLSMSLQTSTDASPLFPVAFASSIEADEFEERSMYISRERPILLSIGRESIVPAPGKDIIAPHVIHRPNVPQPDNKLMQYRLVPFGMPQMKSIKKEPAVMDDFPVNSESAQSIEKIVDKAPVKAKKSEKKVIEADVPVKVEETQCIEKSMDIVAVKTEKKSKRKDSDAPKKSKKVKSVK